MTGDNDAWYFITPDGALFHWDGSSQAGGESIAMLSPEYHEDPALLHEASELYDPPQMDEPPLDMAQVASQLDEQFGLQQPDNDYENWGGIGEKWMQGAESQWYFITTDGGLFEWDESSDATGTLVGQLDASYHADLSTLCRAHTDVSRVAAAVDGSLGLSMAADDYEDWGGIGEKWLQGQGDQWYFITTAGELYAWDGSGQATGDLVAALDARYHEDLSLLTASADAMSQQELDLLMTDVGDLLDIV